MSDVKINQEDNTTTTGDIQPVEPTTTASDTKDAKVAKPKAKAKPATNKKPAQNKATSSGTQAKSPTTDTPAVNSETESKEAKTKELQADKPNANTEKRKRIAKDLFAKNDGLTEIFFTSDFMPFAKEQDAKKHAAGLNDKTVTPITKED